MFKVQTPISVRTEPAAWAAEALGQEGESPFVGLRVTDLRKSFWSSAGEKIAVLNGLSFFAKAGEALAIMGSSGAGKSTLLHLLGGLEAADHGSITVGEFAVDTANPTALVRFRNRRIGFVFQFHNLLPDLTAAENVSLPLLISGMNRRRALVQATQMLCKVGLDERAGAALIGHLSGGEQQRVAVCRALIRRPEVLLADEPTGNLDAEIGAEITRMLIAYARERAASVLVVTHNQAVAEACGRTMELRAGKLYEAGLLTSSAG